MANKREISRMEFTGSLNTDDIRTGCLQRIADASELMAKNYLELQSNRDMYKRWYDQESARNAKLQRQVNAYRGIFNKKKKKS